MGQDAGIQDVKKAPSGAFSALTRCWHAGQHLRKPNHRATILLAHPAVALNQQLLRMGQGFHLRPANPIHGEAPISRYCIGLHLHTPFRQVKTDHTASFQNATPQTVIQQKQKTRSIDRVRLLLITGWRAHRRCRRRLRRRNIAPHTSGRRRWWGWWFLCHEMLLKLGNRFDNIGDYC